MPKGFGSVRTGEVGQGAEAGTLATLARAEARREGFTSQDDTGFPTSGAAAEFHFNRQLEDAGLRATQVALGGGIPGIIQQHFGSNALARALEGGRGGPGGTSNSGSPGSGNVGGIRASLGPTNAGRIALAAIPGIPGQIAGLFGLADRAFGPFPGVIGAGSFAPKVGTQDFRDTVNAGRLARSLKGVRSQRGIGVPGARPSGGLF